MGHYQNNGKLAKNAEELSEEIRTLMDSMYKSPTVQRLIRFEYVCDFHVHNGGEYLSKTDEKNAEEKPEIVIVYDKNYNTRSSDPPLRQVSLIYVFPANGTGFRNRANLKSEHLIFGTYGVESVAKPIKVVVS